MKNNKINNPAIIFGISLILLVINSYAPNGISFLGIEIKQIDFLSDIRTDDFYNNDSDEIEYNEEDDFYKPDSTAINDSVFLEGKPVYDKASIINLNTVSDIIIVELDKLYNYANVVSPIGGSNLNGNLSQLNKFFTALKKADKKQIRIAHYGDSTLEGDLISSDLRELFQEKFGGKGVGMVPITSQDVKFRKTTELSFSDNWETASVYARNKDKLPLGISGHVFVNSDNDWVQMKTTTYYKTVKQFDIIKLFYSNASANSELNYSLNGSKEERKSLFNNNKLIIIEIKNNDS